MGRKSKARTQAQVTTKKSLEEKSAKPLELTPKKDRSPHVETEVILSAEAKTWEIGELLYIKHDYREFVFVEKTDKGIWCRPFSNGSPKNMLHVAFGDVLFAQAPLKMA